MCKIYPDDFIHKEGMVFRTGNSDQQKETKETKKTKFKRVKTKVKREKKD